MSLFLAGDMVTMRSVPRRAWPILIVVLLEAAACSPRPPIPRLLEAWLKAVADAGRPDLSRDEVEQALARQLRMAPVAAEDGANLSNPIFSTRETLTEFYANNGQRLAWCDDSGRILPPTTTLLDARESTDWIRKTMP